MNLEQQLKEAEEQLSIERQKGSEANPRQIANLEQQIKDINSQMIQMVQQHEERVQGSVEHLVNALDNVEIEGLPLRSLFAGEAQYQLVSIWFKEQVAEQAAEFSKQIQGEQLENKQLRDEVKEQEGIITGLKDEIRQLTLERDQANQYRDNAVKQLEEACKEVERLNEQVDELRVEAAVGARNAFKVVTNLDGAKELAEKIRAALPPVTVMEKVDLLGKQFRIVHADTGEEEIIGFLDRGKYRLVNAEEAAEERARFLAEQAAADREDAATDNSLPVGAPIEAPTFQKPDDTEGVHGVQQEADGGNHSDQRADDVPVDAEQVTREEFEAIVKRVERIEKYANITEGAA